MVQPTVDGFGQHMVEPVPYRVLHIAYSGDGGAGRRASDAGTALFCIACPGADIASLPAAAAADIIHLHWPNWTVTPPQISGFLVAGKKVFVTLHDMWMFTRGCHYASGCTQYRTACLKCPQVPDRLGLASASFDEKLANYGCNPNFHVITLCTWMKDMATFGMAAMVEHGATGLQVAQIGDAAALAAAIAAFATDHLRDQAMRARCRAVTEQRNGMAHIGGRPVISTDVGSVAEYVSPEAGFVCDATPQACADAVRALMGNAELCRAMGSAGRAHALDFAWAQVGGRYDQAYGTILQGRAAA